MLKEGRSEQGPESPGPACQEAGVRGVQAFGPLRAPKCLSPEPRWGDQAPVSLLGDSLGGRPSAHCPAAPPPPRPTHSAREGPAVSVDTGLGNFLGRGDERVAFPCCRAVIPRTPAQLLRDLLALWQMDTGLGTQPRCPVFPSLPPLLCCRCRQAAGLVRSPEASPRLPAVGSSAPKPGRAKSRFCPLLA